MRLSLPDPTGDGSPPVRVTAPPTSDLRAASVNARAKAAPPPPLPDLPPAQYAPQPERPIPNPTPPRPADVEMIQGLIKKLAAEVNAAAFEDTPQTNSVPKTRDETMSAPGMTKTAPDASNAPRPDPSVGQSETEDFKVDALRAAAGTMRALDDRAAGQEPPHTDPALNAPAQVVNAHEPNVRIGQVKAAVEAGRVDVLLEPIVGLEDQRMQHFEIALRLRDGADRALELDTHGSTFRGSGVYPLVDQVRLEKTCELAHKLQSRGKTGSVFSRTSGESLIADLFLDRVADAYRAHQAFATRLVMTFAQSDVRAFGPREWATLIDMCDLGFRFAIASVSDLDMDFEDLAERGFEFLKLDAEVFLNGLRAGDGTVPASDICRYVEGLGMSVIVGRIESEDARAQVHQFGVVLGQGALFGAPRLVRAEAMMPASKPTDRAHVAA
ncbi:MAG: EAL domain-containing protein [Pseudomonadota bacterium]